MKSIFIIFIFGILLAGGMISAQTRTEFLLEKNWKFSVADAAERKHWDQYQEAMGKSGPMATDPAVAKKGDHRWVEAPPLPKAPNRTPPQD